MLSLTAFSVNRETMTAPSLSPPTPPRPKSSASPAAAGEGVDIKRVISGSTSAVPIAELSKKGFKEVKVLNQGVIVRLIGEAVDRVIASRSEKITREEREKVIQESKTQFESLARERVKREKDRVTELEKANEALLKETEDLRNELERVKAEGGGGGKQEDLLAAVLDKLKGQAVGGDLNQLQNSIQRIAERLDRLPAGGGGAGAAYVDKEVIIDALFRDQGGPQAESNISKVKIKQEKAGGVKDTLAKLKALQKGGKDGD
jgi:DNA repair exonuclease SbcCD ATPase subunit